MLDCEKQVLVGSLKGHAVRLDREVAHFVEQEEPESEKAKESHQDQKEETEDAQGPPQRFRSPGAFHRHKVRVALLLGPPLLLDRGGGFRQIDSYPV